MTIATPRAYELFGDVCFAGRRNRAFTRLAELSGAQAGDHVLDVGCGTGYLTRHIAARVGPDGAVNRSGPLAAGSGLRPPQEATRGQRPLHLPGGHR
ncbi:hypothetical protein [Streptomyces sp. NBC_00989]|uniref:hypothetical protein n=1 Tax=Streptomyces sp. NBC_00989 TaxID=2903705 RepID=UPI00386F0D76|nr:hypothetical protein OG714_43405 [Streptomyces sp. NBC_00989]